MRKNLWEKVLTWRNLWGCVEIMVEVEVVLEEPHCCKGEEHVILIDL